VVGSTARSGTADTFELPNPIPKSFPLPGDALGLAVDKLDHHWFVAEGNLAAEYEYPSGKLLGTVTPCNNCSTLGIAFDR
jgi:hypothetical protein